MLFRSENNKTNENENECCICFENIGQINNCITPCGHKFCFNCISKNLAYSNVCPYCRFTLVEQPTEDEDEDEDDVYGDEEEQDDDYEDDEESEQQGCVETISEKLKQKGYSFEDLIFYITGRFCKNNNNYNNEYFETIDNDIDLIVNEADNEAYCEYKERCDFEKEDINVLLL